MWLCVCVCCVCVCMCVCVYVCVGVGVRACVCSLNSYKGTHACKYNFWMFCLAVVSVCLCFALCVKYIGMNMKSKIVVKLYGVINLTLSCS